MASVSVPRRELVLGTRNLKKRGEMVQLLCPPWEDHPRLSRLVILTLDEAGATGEVEEDAPDFAGNARKKAAEFARMIGRWVLADDSGLMVDALQGAPGVLSARYAGTHGDDAANNRKLLNELGTLPPDQRGAAFVCALALADPTGAIRAESVGQCRGRIVTELRGSGGFGYDPLFLIPEYHATFGELPAAVKHRISHRARAFDHLRPLIDRLLVQNAWELQPNA
ncbi:non-canonical purine NTP pyrophosphatase, rdgB/HAM1 family [Isosphaera pallida ATCC 43644]|uniref:dITP/XTP pyrophosphatase n=1 Tax=Isosphaera pallida (strain ATCC 43644 / DSM 9630 / IS1B) TaxID=575540 RepID=E8R6S8_ISOPI|nr:non-canonical purine NTP pyrophosphatase [Isosphaera pallida]ADV63980.1 non-canonical purine NTP pyrophosphatase, rdgB/HAM1 family [Isosphaera pallida ATCC 43644]